MFANSVLYLLAICGGVSLPVAGEVTALGSEIWWCESLGVLVYRKDSPEDYTTTQASWAFYLSPRVERGR